MRLVLYKIVYVLRANKNCLSRSKFHEGFSIITPLRNEGTVIELIICTFAQSGAAMGRCNHVAPRRRHYIISMVYYVSTVLVLSFKIEFQYSTFSSSSPILGYDL